MRMKTIIISTCVLLTKGFTAHAQEDLLKAIKSGFKSGQTTEIVPYLNQRTEIAFEGEKQVYDKNKAEQVIAGFFAQNKSKDFQVLHQGASKEGLKFYIGELNTNNGTFRVLVYLKNNGGKSLIENIDISKE